MRGRYIHDLSVCALEALALEGLWVVLPIGEVNSVDRDGQDIDIFDTLQKFKLKLNPEKCSFGVEFRKFFGFMLTRRGIEANPEKCKAIMEVKSPTSIKEVL